MRAAPGTVGRPLHSGVVRLLDEQGEPAAEGEVGRIFVSNPMTFQGYTGGEDKQRVDGLVATGDVGRFDEDGRLFVEGRDDDMIVSGGENVFPGQVEELLLARAQQGVAPVEGGASLARAARRAAARDAADPLPAARRGGRGRRGPLRAAGV